ncbi:outer membrane protein OmpA [Candidatus Pandoraea novymonadis]|uniref:Outer membrane protein A n=1 Tax=Candidatus Pandoraea novymonadis TaxID=1808959 RepID=A0ABX5FEX1_9BURK|nr:OmpA family protein [Candidatus Pandoraea novymonadis]PSB92243.1 Outer membrane protein A [Candidatus Pandoraea novymonadis]
MNKFPKLAIVAATAVMATSTMAKNHIQKVSGPVPVSQQSINGNWVNGGEEQVWKNGMDELCWRDSSWTPGTSNAKCDGSFITQAPKPTPVLVRAPIVPTSHKVTYQADALFDFDKAILSLEGKAKLDDLVLKIRDVDLEVIVATGHTDQIGSDKYNDHLSIRRAESVKAYLLSQGIDSNRVYTEGKGKRNPVITEDCNGLVKTKLKACLSPNRRVEVEVVGTSK